MNLLMMQVVGGGDLGEKPSNHLNDICNRHGADLILAVLRPLPRGLRPLRLGQNFFTSEGVDMGQIADLDPTGRTGL